jgi:outer membrane protein assembly factor BamA
MGLFLPVLPLRRSARRALLVALALAAFARPSCELAAQAKEPDRRDVEVNRITFIGNTTFDGGLLANTIQSQETPSGFSKFLHSTFGEKFGSKPEIYQPEGIESDLKLIQDYYRSRGFYGAVVADSVTIDSAAARADVFFLIQEGKRSFVETVTYAGLDSIPADLKAKILAEPLLKPGMPYETSVASAEIARVLTFLVNNGYPTARCDYERYLAQLFLSTNNFRITFVFAPGRQYVFGAVTVKVDPPRDDITDDLSIRHLDFTTGELYSREKKITSERNLNRLGLFEAARVDHVAIPDTSSSRSIPMEILVRPRPRNELSPEVIVSNENNAFNIGLGLGYTNRNFLGDGRSFNIRARGRTQSIRELFAGKSVRDTSVIGSADLQMQVLQPFLFNRTISGSVTSEVRADKQQFFILSILRLKAAVNKQVTQFTSGTLEWTLERVRPELLVDTANQKYVIAQFREEDQEQFNSILTFTLQSDHTNDPFSPTEGYFRSIALEESGILPKLVTVGLPFTQYYKTTLLGRWYTDLSTTRYNIFAAKVKTGYQDKYGESRTKDVRIPLNRRFFAGGSGSVRGWKARQLGAMNDDLLELGGNFILEASAEMRVNYLRGFGKFLNLKLDNIWGVYFLDIGNVWSDLGSFRVRDIAVAAGIGFRYETLFGPFRIDYGFRVYDPKGEGAQQSIFHKRFFGETLGEAVLHFGIGHAF